MTTERWTKLPPLESGDRLSRTEFERRYAAMPALKKAELIEGVVYVASPLRAKAHGKPHGDIRNPDYVPTGDILKAICRTYGVQPGDILKYEPDEQE